MFLSATDGLDDLLAKNSEGTQIFFNDGSGNLVEQPKNNPADFSVTTMKIIDINNDSMPDMILGGSEGLLVRIKVSSEAYKDISIKSCGAVVLFAAVDLDNDLDLDLMVMNPKGVISVLENNYPSKFTDTKLNFAEKSVASIYVKDLNNDWYDDIVLVLESGAEKIIWNQGDWIFQFSNDRSQIGNPKRPQTEITTGRRAK